MPPTPRPANRAQRRKKTPEPEVQEVQLTPEDAPENGNAGQESPPDGVVLLKKVGPDGALNIIPQTLGTVQVTEVQTIIELGLKAFREQIGLNQKN